MDKKPKEGFLPVAVAGGAMVICCLVPLLLVSGASGLTAWLGGIDPLLAVGIAVAIFAVIVLFRRMRKPASTGTDLRRPQLRWEENNDQ